MARFHELPSKTIPPVLRYDDASGMYVRGPISRCVCQGLEQKLFEFHPPSWCRERGGILDSGPETRAARPPELEQRQRRANAEAKPARK